jgi:hypothetical protein
VIRFRFGILFRSRQSQEVVPYCSHHSLSLPVEVVGPGEEVFSRRAHLSKVELAPLSI